MTGSFVPVLNKPQTIMKTNGSLRKDVQDAIKQEPFLNAAGIGVTAKDGVGTYQFKSRGDGCQYSIPFTQFYRIRHYTNQRPATAIQLYSQFNQRSIFNLSRL